MAGVDLTRARLSATDKVLLDRCSITRNPEGQRDAVFDAETGDYAADPDETEILATDVPCMAREMAALDGAVGSAPAVVKRWTVKLDFATVPDDLRVGDTVTLTTSTDPLLEGVPLRVNDVVTKTLRVWREVECSRRSDGTGRR